jgi:hypothetical protein
MMTLVSRRVDKLDRAFSVLFRDIFPLVTRTVRPYRGVAIVHDLFYNKQGRFGNGAEKGIPFVPFVPSLKAATVGMGF